MSEKPVIGVIGCNRTFEGETAHLAKARYITGVREFAGAVPVIVPGFAEPGDALTLLGRLDAVLLTGTSSNIEPGRYGAGGDGHTPFDPKRDATMLALIAAARQLNMPLYGICRGLQEINVAFGGSLRDLRDDPDQTVRHHAAGDPPIAELFETVHPADVAPGSTLRQLVGTDRIEVNSAHFQTVARLGDGLRVEATAADGVVEAIAARDGAPLLAVQWHPEWQPETRAHHLAFWQFLGDAARVYLGAKLTSGRKAG